jgi:predicted DNA-binding protein (UPF0251 family)
MISFKACDINHILPFNFAQAMFFVFMLFQLLYLYNMKTSNKKEQTMESVNERMFVTASNKTELARVIFNDNELDNHLFGFISFKPFPLKGRKGDADLLAKKMIITEKVKTAVVSRNDFAAEDAVSVAKIWLWENIQKAFFDDDFSPEIIGILTAKACWIAFNQVRKDRQESILPIETLNTDNDDDFNNVLHKILLQLPQEELLILRLIASGLTQVEIAERLKISRRRLNYKLSALRQLAKKMKR